MKKNIFTFNISEKAIYVSSINAKKMTTFGTVEYKQFVEIRRDFPDYQIVVLPSTKKTYKGLTLEKMATVIEKYDANPVEALTQFRYVQRCGELRSAKSAYARKWFLEKYADYLAEYDLVNALIGNSEQSKKAS